MNLKRLFCFILTIFVFTELALLFAPAPLEAQEIITEKSDGTAFDPREFLVPYIFSTDTLEEAAGVTAGVRGHFQEQLGMLATAIASTNGSYGFFVLGQDLKLPLGDRLFLDWVAAYGDYDEIENYTNGNPNFPDERAGSNDSDKNNFITNQGTDIMIELPLKYVLPIGAAKDDPITRIVLNRGVRLPGEEQVGPFNPLESGKTTFELEPFYRELDLDADDDLEDDFDVVRTAGVRTRLRYSNLDFRTNPSSGSEIAGTFSRDWGALASSAPWSVWNVEASKFLSLGRSDWFRQRVLAFNFWNADTPTWNSSHREGEREVFHRPPFFEGASLGGVHRLRGFPNNRFSDKSAIYYSGELRMIPHWHPLGNIALLNSLQIDWWQFVLFGEAGRVADHYAFNEFHKKMKWDAGFALRAMVSHLVVRVDVAFSEEDTIVQMFVAQPFPR